MAKSKRATMAVEEQAKTDVYCFLAGIFSSHPTQDTVWGLCQMAEVLGVSCTNDFSLPALDREYMDLFVVPNPRYVAPYESVYRDRWLPPSLPAAGGRSDSASVMIKGLLMGDSTLNVQQCYVEAGVMPDDDLPDHIANELRLMAYLSARQAEIPASDAKSLAGLQARLRQEHLMQWIGQLRERVVESDHLGYYTAALEVAELVLQGDA